MRGSAQYLIMYNYVYNNILLLSHDYNIIIIKVTTVYYIKLCKFQHILVSCCLHSYTEYNIILISLIMSMVSIVATH